MVVATRLAQNRKNSKSSIDFFVGYTSTQDAVNNELAAALSQIIIQFPDRIYSNDISIWHSIKSIALGLWKIPKLFLGTIENIPKFTQNEIKSKIDKEKIEFILSHFHPIKESQRIITTSENSE